MFSGHHVLRSVGHRRLQVVARAVSCAGRAVVLVIADLPFFCRSGYRLRNRLSVNWEMYGAKLVDAR